MFFPLKKSSISCCLRGDFRPFMYQKAISISTSFSPVPRLFSTFPSTILPKLLAILISDPYLFKDTWFRVILLRVPFPLRGVMGRVLFKSPTSGGAMSISESTLSTLSTLLTLATFSSLFLVLLFSINFKGARLSRKSSSKSTSSSS